MYSQVRRIDAQLDRLQLTSAASATAADVSTSSSATGPVPSPRVETLQSLIQSLSTRPSVRNPLLSVSDIQACLSQSQLLAEANAANAAGADEPHDDYEKELEWLLVSKATAQVYGCILSRLLDETVALADDIWYWDDVLGSRRYTALYSVQTSPLRLWDWGSSVWDDVRRRGGHFSVRGIGEDAQNSLGQRWKEFYGLVREVVRERSVKEIQRRAVNPVARIRSEVRQKQTNLKRARLRGANALGVLLGEGLMNESMHGEGLATPNAEHAGHKWKASVARNVALMDAVLVRVNDESLAVEKFDAAIAEETEEDPLYEVEIYSEGDGVSTQPAVVAERLMHLLTTRMPEYQTATKALVKEHGRPSRIVRYWLPITVGILSSGTVLRILVNRKAEIITWIEDLGSTVIDFWRNWVVEPTRKVIGTIRHDEGSEVSIMSKRSLEGDRASLERMVVDFAIDNPDISTDTGAPLTDAEIADIRVKVREGDLTPVLRAYEKDLASPFMGTVRGNLIRALLIQIQKTKVDVEVAMGGIDSLLKSQELVFGFVGLTPGILVCIGFTRWIRSTFSSRRGTHRAKKQGQMIRQLRNIDRVLANSTPTDFGELYYKDHGLLLCEVHVLRQAAHKAMPAEVYREFLEEIEELVDVRTGVKRQRKVVKRMRWAYARWF